MRRAAVALLHDGVVARDGSDMVTTITNLDLHDMARCVRAYGLAALYVVHPLANQRIIAERIRHHWVAGSGGRRIPARALALERLRVVGDLAAACADLFQGHGAECPECWSTSAVTGERACTSFVEARRRLHTEGCPVMICFGTGWGLNESSRRRMTLQLEPIRARAHTGYHHLSVRSACAIALDRLLG